jgi:hypothetical protein
VNDTEEVVMSHRSILHVPARIGLGVAGLLVLVLAMGSGRALAANSDFLVTYAARSCPSYTDVTANLARNDIQESLRDLGADTLYTSGEPISPAKEQQGQPNCTPIVGWKFTLGSNYVTRADDGTWGSLSKVTGAFDTSIVTRPSVPLLDSQGDPTGTRLPGAVTVALTDDQAQLASQYGQLWLQGGVPGDPVLDKLYPQKYGFAALRCAIDNLNGDNVETLQYPQGVRHIFCYAYYVTPPPTSGTIIVRKQVTDPTATAQQAFSYEGNISYTSDHTFTLNASYGKSAQTTFIRGATGSGDAPWSFSEEPLAGWKLTGLDCTSALGTSTTTTDRATGEASVRLGPGDTVTCTYSNELVPPDGALVLAKETLGATGSFPFVVSGRRQAHETLTTRKVGVPVAGTPLQLPPGSYHVRERLPQADAEGSWSVAGVTCNGARRQLSTHASVTVSADKGAFCLFRNRFTPNGSIRIHKITLGGVGTALFTIRTLSGGPRRYAQSATTKHAGRPVLATGNDTTRLALGRYAITESAAVTPDRKQWVVDHILCDGRPVAAARGQLVVQLTRANPHIDCTAVNRLVSVPPTPTPPTPPPPNPSPPNPGPPNPSPPNPTPLPSPSPKDLVPADGPTANLSVTKTVTPKVAHPGERLHYRIVIVNHGPDPASDVVAAELGSGRQSLQIQSSQGRCIGHHPASCRLGTIKPGKRVVITVTSTAGSTGFHTNRVGVVTSTRDPNLANNVASATVIVRPAKRPPGGRG